MTTDSDRDFENTLAVLRMQNLCYAYLNGDLRPVKPADRCDRTRAERDAEGERESERLDRGYRTDWTGGAG